MARKANSIFVCVVIFKHRYSPIPDLWDWTYRLWKKKLLSQRGSCMDAGSDAYIKSILDVPLLRGDAQVVLGNSQKNNFKN